jgi:hypothetical protein
MSTNVLRPSPSLLRTSKPQARELWLPHASSRSSTRRANLPSTQACSSRDATATAGLHRIFCECGNGVLQHVYECKRWLIIATVYLLHSGFLSCKLYLLQWFQLSRCTVRHALAYAPDCMHCCLLLSDHPSSAGSTFTNSNVNMTKLPTCPHGTHQQKPSQVAAPPSAC